MDIPQSASLPPLKNLFQDAWTAFKRSIYNLFMLALVEVAGLVLIVAVAVLVGLVFGLSGLLAKGPQAANAAAYYGQHPLSAVGLVIFFLMTIIILIYFLTATVIADVLILADEQKTLSALPALKKGFRLVVPVTIADLVVALLIFGGMTLFLIPGILFSFLFTFVKYEIILGNRSWPEAFSSGAAVVKKHFGDIFVRFIVFIFFYFIMVLAIPNLLKQLLPNAAALIGFYSFIVYLCIGWFALAFNITLYKQAKAATPKDERLSLTGPVIIAVIGWLMFFLIVGLLTKTIGSRAGRLFDRSSKRRMQPLLNTRVSSFQKSDTLAQEFMDKMNAYRTNRRLKPYEEDSSLCAFAQRRLDELTQRGSFDSYKGFYEAIANPQIVKAYFADFGLIGERVWTLTNSLTSGSEVLNAEVNAKTFNPAKSVVANPAYTHACVKSSSLFLIITTGQHK
ncbi:hypothetical protein HY214_03000 [Candidatus Roizmanbacteria bacterium]|nr:hypothetical protein [Candidatus Roizmanbacteria bacterium]